MIETHWPLFGLRLQVADLELRLPSTDDLAALGDLAADGIHEPGAMPFSIPWSDAEPAERARTTIQWQWKALGEWTPQRWALNLVVIHAGQIVGTQAIEGTDFAVTRQFETGSWLGQRFQGKGIGTAMRSAVLHLGFEGLGAETAISGAFFDNHASSAVSRKVGYSEDGIEVVVRKGERALLQRLRMDRSAWLASARPDVTVTGLEPCLALFGLGQTESASPGVMGE